MRRARPILIDAISRCWTRVYSTVRLTLSNSAASLIMTSNLCRAGDRSASGPGGAEGLSSWLRIAPTSSRCLMLVASRRRTSSWIRSRRFNAHTSPGAPQSHRTNRCDGASRGVESAGRPASDARSRRTRKVGSRLWRFSRSRSHRSQDRNARVRRSINRRRVRVAISWERFVMSLPPNILSPSLGKPSAFLWTCGHTPWARTGQAATSNGERRPLEERADSTFRSTHGRVM